ncbi:aldo/keto reductase [Mycobacterium sp. NAZ190054]|nr:aldo/keto reductase [Mycobacterium sp. NAZ190054]
MSGTGAADRIPLGLGTAPLGNLFSTVSDQQATETINTAWDLGIRTFDTAPLYGYGESERRLGEALAQYPRDEFVVSTKVGRLIRHGAPPSPEQLFGGEHFYKVDGDVNPVFDYSHDGVLRSLEESLQRLGMDRIDLLYIHDPDDHFDAALHGAFPALRRLRDEGVVRAIGVGMNQTAMLSAFAREADFDYFLVAGRYTLLDQQAADELFPLCDEHGIGVIGGGVFNSGVLAAPTDNATYNYVPATPEVLTRARRIQEICRGHGVELASAAMQFPHLHPSTAGVLVGARSADEIRTNIRLYRHPIPAALWDALTDEGLIRRQKEVRS